MATIVELVATGNLFKLDASLDADQQEFREIYASPKLRGWIGNDLPQLVSTWKIEVSPIQQLDALVAIFAAGEPLAFDIQFNCLTPHEDGVWELKTPDLRMFGWFHKKDCFIGCDAGDATWIKEHRLYSGYRDQVKRFRDLLDLNEPKFVIGNHPNDVVSDWNFAK